MKYKENNIAVVIPIYKSQWDERETIALKQALNVLSKYDIIAVLPENLVLKESGFSKAERFADSYFTGIESYNKLMLSADFYRRFLPYEYILIYQLDAFVFSDKLLYFCDLDFDYIGAPWLHGMFHYKDDTHVVWYVGNGGLSLRKVNSFLRVIEKINPLEGDWIKNEDLFFSSLVNENFRVAPVDIALQFAFERQVKKCFEMNHHQLPFGCHAWERYDAEFWKPYMEDLGFDLRKVCFEYGNEDILRENEYIHWKNLCNIFLDDKRREKVENKLKKLFFENNREILIWGAGFYGASIARWFHDIGIHVVCFWDNNRRLEGKTLNHIPIIHPSNEKFDRNSYIVIANYMYEDEIEQQLLDGGLVAEENYMLFSQLADL